MDSESRNNQSCAFTVHAPDGRAAILQFSRWMARKRVLGGLTRRLLVGQRADVRSMIEQSLHTHGVPASVADATIGWLSRPRVIVGLARRRALAGADAVQVLIAPVLEKALPPVAAVAAPSANPAPPAPSLNTSKFRVDTCEHLLLPGVPADYLDTPVWHPEFAALLAEPSVMLQLRRDRIPLPTTYAREGYCGDRHLEYWLYGLDDMRKLVAATGLDRLESPRILDFGGASARVIRHFVGWKPGADLYLSDLNPQHILLARRMFDGAVTAFRNSGPPHLPFADDFLDCVVAFDVFSSIDADDTAWLLELRRVVKPGGCLWITIHDQATWDILPRTMLAHLLSDYPEFAQYYAANPQLTGRLVYTFSDATYNNCQVFHGSDYIDRFWAPLFTSCTTVPLAHDYMSALILRV